MSKSHEFSVDINFMPGLNDEGKAITETGNKFISRCFVVQERST